MTSAPDARGLSTRQRTLLDAAVVVAATSGLRGLTHRAVDRQAGLPEGSCSVSYRTRLALLTALAQHVGAALADDVRALEASLPPRPREQEPVGYAAAGLLFEWIAEPNRLICMAELTLEAVRTPCLRSSLHEWRELLVDLVTDVAHRARPRAHADATVASLEGVLLATLAEKPADRPRRLGELLEIVLRAMGAYELDEQQSTG